MTGTEIFLPVRDYDLAATLDVRALAKGVLAAQHGFATTRLATIFPGSEGVAPQAGLLRG